MSKGFTLIELLAVIVILAIIALIATPLVLNIISDTKDSAGLRSAEFYLDAVEQAIIKEKLRNTEFTPKTCEIRDSKLYCNGSEEEIVVEVDGQKPTSGTIVFEENGTIGKTNLEYGNRSVIKTTDGELVYSYCKLKQDNGEPGISIGDKYQCRVKNGIEENSQTCPDCENGYFFYVLSYNDEDGNITNDITQAVTYNLIMDRNICEDGTVATATNKCHVAWNSDQVDNKYGPVTAMNYLHNATKDWENVTNMIMDYEDENKNYDIEPRQYSQVLGNSGRGTSGYKSIKTIGNVTTITSKTGSETLKINESLKARLPRFDEIYGIDKCLRNKDNGGPGSCKLWLVGNLDSSGTVYVGSGKESIANINGYWLLSSYYFSSDKYSQAYLIYKNGNLTSGIITDSIVGVRPVITIKL